MQTVSRHKYIPLRHEADYCLDLGKAIGVVGEDLTTEIFLTEKELHDAGKFLGTLGIDKQKPILGITPGSGHSSPNWTTERYIEFTVELLHRHDMTVVVGGTSDERTLIDAFHDLELPNIITLPAIPLRQFIGVVSQCNFFFSASTGPMHIAAALKIPTLSLFCPLPACSPTLWGPQGNISEVIVAPDNVCQITCEKDPHICTMHDVNVPMVIERFEALYNRVRTGKTTAKAINRHEEIIHG
jgi:ADP-heptose:LPS heptosyltransferase